MSDSLTVHASLGEWFDEHRREFDAIIFDIDGVLVCGKEPIGKGIALVDRLRDEGFAFSLLTNDGSNSTREKSAELRAHGLHVLPEEIVSCSDGMVEAIESRGKLSSNLFFVMGELGDPCYAAAAGLRVTRDMDELDKCAGVIVGEDNFDWEMVINAVVNFFVEHREAMMIVPNPDEFYPDVGGRITIAAGGHARFIQHVLEVNGTKMEPVYLGKPYGPIFEHNHRVFEERMSKKLERGRVLMAGDSLTSDIKGANEFGYVSALILTGITRLEMIDDSEVKPRLVFEEL